MKMPLQFQCPACQTIMLLEIQTDGTFDCPCCRAQFKNFTLKAEMKYRAKVESVEMRLYFLCAEGEEKDIPVPFEEKKVDTSKVSYRRKTEFDDIIL